VVTQHGEAADWRRHPPEERDERLDVAGVERHQVAAQQEQVRLEPRERGARLGDRERVRRRPGVEVGGEGDPQRRGGNGCGQAKVSGVDHHLRLQARAIG